ncbi:MAG: Lar family restriction alleviation protein [Ectothiorhodospiraceae bacterium]|nr:Lar family restriction alleviation protein [Ectothiorhodospiraceae bacterium]
MSATNPPVKISPCPFCEGPPVIVEKGDPEWKEAFVFCHECGARGPTAEEFDVFTGREVDDVCAEATSLWNTRDSRHRDLYEAGDAERLNQYPRSAT